jgi:hypothetical protein
MVRDLLIQAVVAVKELRNNAMGSQDELAAFVTANPKLAWEFISILMDTAEAVDPIKGILDYDQDPVDLETADFATGYCIAQTDRNGLFNKPCKVIGGISHAVGERVRRYGIVEPGDGDYLTWNTWQEANAVLESMEPDIRAAFRVFPVLLAFGVEAKRVKPRDERPETIDLPPAKAPSEDEIRCPHCNEVYVLPEVAELNCENYGTTGFNLKHSCGHVIRVLTGREVKVYGIERAPPTATDDFGEGATDPAKK